MMLIKCPYCEERRPEVEFSYAGQAHISRPDDPATLSDAEWENFLFIRENARGIMIERWLHAHGCARYFNAVRHSVSDRFYLTYKAGAPKPSDEDIAKLVAAPQTEADK